MSYCNINYKTKKELKEAVKRGKQLRVFNPISMFPVKDNGIEFLEGPHYPAPHTWYAQAELLDGIIVRIK